MTSMLFDLQNDYEQLNRLEDAEKEADMCKKLEAGMREAQAPEEQYVRLGLKGTEKTG